MEKILYIFRHGQTDWNKQRRLQGHADIPLNEEGRTQARSLIPFFQAHPVEMVFASDLDRAVETASLATGVPMNQVLQYSGLKEVRLGILDGHYEDQIVQIHGEEALEKWRSLEDEHRHFAFEGGESRQECNDRITNTLIEICEGQKFTNAAVCSHGFAMRRLFHHFLEEKVIPPMIANCVVYRVVYRGGVFYPEI